jgi:acyl-CoA hydrolase
MKTIEDSQTLYSELMIPAYANFGGKVHGGLLLSILDKVAYVCASRHSGSYVVTVAVEGVEFLSPVEVGDLLTVKASVNYVGRTTMIVGMKTESFNPRTGKARHTISCYFTMAAKTEEGELTEVPGLIIRNKTELVRFCEGRLIREMSKHKRSVLKNDFDGHSIEHLKDLCAEERCRIDLVPEG